VPKENIISVEKLPNIGKWIAISEAPDGAVFYGVGNTEPLARRIAGLRTFEYLKNAPQDRPGKESEYQRSKQDLIRALGELNGFIECLNEEIPTGTTKNRLLAEIKVTQELVSEGKDRSAIARYALPTLLFIAVAFAQGVIGAYAEKCLALVSKLIGAG